MRKIIHIDMDAFFASVEQRDFPELKGKAIAVGGSKERGVVAAASYEARKYGVKSAMSSALALKKCPHLIFRPSRFEAYKAVSSEIRKIFFAYTDLVEPLSLDEAYLDVTENKKGIPSATKIANLIREEIYEKTGLTASAGISCNKFVAKVASDFNKPNGYFLVKPDQVQKFIDALPIKKFHGIGKVTAQKFTQMGVLFGKDLRTLSLPLLKQHFGKAGDYYFALSRGVDKRPVLPQRDRKSVGAEQTFDREIRQKNILHLKLTAVLDKAWERLCKGELKARTLTLKIKFSDFTVISRSYTLNDAHFKDSSVCLEILKEQLAAISYQQLGIRLLGVSFSKFWYPEAPKKGTQLTFDF